MCDDGYINQREDSMRINADNINSSMIARMVWDDDTMDVVFNSGVMYRYEGVERSVFTTVTGSDSVGKAFIALVKGADYPYRRIALKA